MAAKADRVDSIQALLEGGANINLVDARGRSALTKASDMTSKWAIKFLLENGASPQLHTPTSFGNLLNSAAFSGSIPLLEYFLSTRQVDCNLKDDVGRNATHFAALATTWPHSSSYNALEQI
jgi:ankyrin repeat protein